ncbi:MAG: hypothetical protein WHV44_01855 [Anaerolineales bacterium]
MNKKTGGIIATVVTALCCGLPGCFSLCFGLISAFASAVPGANIDIGGSSDPAAALATGLAAVCGGIIFIAIPVAVGFFTLRKKPAATNADFDEPLPPAA